MAVLGACHRGRQPQGIFLRLSEVKAFQPGIVMMAATGDGGAQSFHELMDPLHPRGRIGEVSEVANLIVWLCSPRASFVTGANIPIDGC